LSGMSDGVHTQVQVFSYSVKCAVLIVTSAFWSTLCKQSFQNRS